MSSRKRYKLWQQSDVTIPRRTLTRLKKRAKEYVANIHVPDDINENFKQDEPESAEVLAEQNEDNEYLFDSNNNSEEPAMFCYQANDVFSMINDNSENLECNGQDQFHLPEESDYRENDNYVCEFESSDSDSSDFDTAEKDDGVPVFPGASVTVKDSILSIMKFSITLKTTYSALSDLLGLLSLHLPKESSKEHLRSLCFLKKALAANQKDDILTTHEYCSACFGPLGNEDITCRVCNKEKRNNFLSILECWGTNEEHV